MNTANTRHEINLWRGGFSELVQGKPFHVRLDDGHRPDDILVVREYDEAAKRLTGAVAMFRITWVTRPGDYDGMLSVILPEGTVVLGLAPANVMVVEGGRVSMIVNGHRPPGLVENPIIMNGHGPVRPHPAPSPPDTSAPVRAETPPTPSVPALLADVARVEARRLQSLAKAHRFDPRDLADAVHRELARAPTLPNPHLRRPPASAAPPS